MGINLLLVILAAIFMSWVTGASTIAATFGPVACSKMSGVLRSALLAGIFGLIGAVVQGEGVAKTVGIDLLPGFEITPLLGTVILITAGNLLLLGVLAGYPIPVAFTVVGGVLGAGWGVGAAWNIPKVQIIVSTWVITPFAVVTLSYVLARILRHIISDENSGRLPELFLFILGAFFAYSAGANKVGQSMGLLLSSVNAPTIILLLLGGVSMLLGTWFGGPRIIDSVSKNYSEMGVRRSISALATAGVIAQLVTILGIPICFNYVLIFCMIGSGLVEGTSRIQSTRIVKTIITWTASFFVSMGICLTLTSLFS